MNEAQEAFLGEVRRLLGPPVYIKPEEVPFVEISDPDRLCQSPLVSVVCITYNHAKYIGKTFQGFEEQITNFPVEIIIGEDCSTDNTLELCKAFQIRTPEKTRILSWRNNVGASSNFLRSLRQCRGKYIAVCEGDDFWCNSQKLQDQVDYLESHPECGMVHSDAHVRNVKTQRNIGRTHAADEEIPCTANQAKDRLLIKWSVTTCSAVFRRGLLLALWHSFPTVFYRKRRLSDIPLWSGLLSVSTAYYSPNIYATYQLSAESASRSRNPDQAMLLCCDTFDAYMESCEVFNEGDLDTHNKIVTRYARQLSYLAYKAHRRDLVKMAVAALKGSHSELATADRILAFCAERKVPFILVRQILRAVSLCRDPYSTLSRYVKRIGSLR